MCWHSGQTTTMPTSHFYSSRIDHRIERLGLFGRGRGRLVCRGRLSGRLGDWRLAPRGWSRAWIVERCLWCRSWLRRLRNLLQDRTALLYGLIRPEYQCKSANHEHYRAPRRRLRQNVRGTAWPESGLATRPAEGTREVSSFPALQQYYDDKYHAVDHEETRQEPPGIAKAYGDNPHSYQQRYRPFHPNWHSFFLAAQRLAYVLASANIYFDSGPLLAVFTEVSSPSHRTTDNGRERLGVQARPANQCPVQLFLGHQALNVIRFNAATIKDTQGRSTFR